MSSLESLSVRIFVDGADRFGRTPMARHPLISVFTTNPTLIRQAGVLDCRAFARDVLTTIPDRPNSS